MSNPQIKTKTAYTVSVTVTAQELGNETDRYVVKSRSGRITDYPFLIHQVVEFLKRAELLTKKD